MRDYNQNRYSNGGGNRFSRRDSGKTNYRNNASGPREMFPAVCDNCGRDCEVPFKPSGDKPIYCSDCFEKRGGNDRERNTDDRSFKREGFHNRENQQDDWGANRQTGYNRSEERHETKNSDAGVKQQLDAINAKLNQILKALELGGDSKNKPEIKEAVASSLATKAKTQIKKAKPAAKSKKAAKKS